MHIYYSVRASYKHKGGREENIYEISRSYSFQQSLEDFNELRQVFWDRRQEALDFDKLNTVSLLEITRESDLISTSSNLLQQLHTYKYFSDEDWELLYPSGFLSISCSSSSSNWK